MTSQPDSTGRGAADRPVDRPAVSGIVLAGGRSVRFGSDKLAAVVEGATLLERSIAALEAVCDEVVVVAAPGSDIEDRLGRSRPWLRVVHDPEPHGGPLVGILAGLGVAADPLALVVGGDMPWLEPAVLRLLVDELVAVDVAAAAALEGRQASLLGAPSGPRLERFPVALRVEPARVTARRLVVSGERRVAQLLDGLAVRVVPLMRWRALDPEGRSTKDVDRPEDL